MSISLDGHTHSLFRNFVLHSDFTKTDIYTLEKMFKINEWEL
jgi:hypothetical protein